jgi:hypothetical protein
MSAAQKQTSHDVIETLTLDHTSLAQSIDAFYAAPSAHYRRRVLRRTCAGLRVHFALEADVFYRDFLVATGDTLSHYVALVNQETVKNIIEEIELADPDDPSLWERMKELSRLVEHHIEEAEKVDGLFAQVRAAGVCRS